MCASDSFRFVPENWGAELSMECRCLHERGALCRAVPGVTNAFAIMAIVIAMYAIIAVEARHQSAE
eukprot:7386092-Prymnesium_polylepis.2